jgi:plasmid stabilization system protein ParE
MTQLAVEFHPEAVIEARAAREWYASKSADAAAAFLAELDAGITSIQAAAELYPAYLHGTRRYLMRRFPYLIVYRCTSTVIQIVAVAHGRRRPGYWKARSTG